MKHTATFSVLLLLVIFSSSIVAQNSGFGLIFNSKFKTWEAEKKIRSLPFCNQKLHNKGNSTPKPFGININSFFYNQDYFGTELELVGQIDGNDEPIPVTIYVDSMYQNTSVMEFKTNIRPNIWLFPFLNIYGIIGYTAGQVNPNITVPYFYVEIINDIDTIYQRVDTSFSITERPAFHGPSFGAGATLSIGFSRFFILADYNFIMSNPLQVDGKLYSHSIMPKIGILLGNKSSQLKGAFWVGAMGFYNDQFFSGEIDVRDIDRDLESLTGRYIDYRGDIKAYSGQQWNFITGCSWIFDTNNSLLFEIGVYPRTQASISYNYSF